MTEHTRLRLWALALAIGWTSLFFFNNRWIGEWLERADVFVSWGDILRGTLVPLFILILVLGAMFTLGIWMLKGFHLHQEKNSGEQTVLAFAFGAGVLAFLHILLGFLGGIHAYVLGPMYAALFAAGFGSGYFSLRLPTPAWTPYRLLMASLICWGLGNGWLHSLTPPTEIDTIAHHFAHLEIWADKGRFIHLPWMMHANWPLLGEILYLGPITLGFDTAAQGLHWSFGVLVVGALLYFWRDRLSLDIRLTAAALYATFPIVTHYLGTGHNDQIWTFLLITAFYLLTESQGRRRAIVAAGVLAGFGAGCRYHAMYGAACLLVAAWLAPGWFRIRRQDVVIAMAAAAAVVSPWLLKNAWLMGNPVWPLLYLWFGGRHWSADILHGYMAICWRDPNPLHWLARDELKHLWHPTVAPHASHYFLFPLGFALLCKRLAGSSWLWNGVLLWYLLYSPAALIFETNWLRFSLPWLALSSLYLSEQALSLRLLGPLLLTLAFVPSLVVRFYEPAPSLLGLRNAAHPERTASQSYLEWELPVWSAHRLIEALTPSTARILLFREMSGYGLKRQYRWGAPLDQGMIRYAQMNSAESLLEALRGQGITHVLDSPGARVTGSKGRPLYTSHALALMEALLTQHGRVIGKTKGYVLWELR